MTSNAKLGLMAVLTFGALAAAEGARPLEVFQGLEEATARIGRLKDKPFEKLIALDGTVQPEMLIFTDTGTGNEVWSLTTEQCTELANIERRCPWNSDGSLVSFTGNRTWRSPDGKIGGSAWTGNKYLMRADGVGRKKLYCTAPNGQKGIAMGDKFNLWDRRDPRALYYTLVKDGDAWRTWSRSKPGEGAMWLVRVRVDDDLTGRIEPIHEFRNNKRKITQTIADNNLLVIQDVNSRSMEDVPDYYVIDLNKKSGEEGFVRRHSLRYGITDVKGHDPDNEYQVHGISINRAGTTVSWNYGSSTSSGEPITFSVPADDLNAKPTVWKKEMDPYEQYMSHSDVWSDGRRAYFGGHTEVLLAKGVRRHWGLWIRLGGRLPMPIGPAAAGGHCTWAGRDPEWFFASVTRSEKSKTWETPVNGKIVAGNIDGKTWKVLCDPYDRRRGGKSSYASIPRAIQSPDATKCWFHSSMLMPKDDDTGSFIVIFRRPHAPVKLVWANGGLAWVPHEISHEVEAWRVYQKDGQSWRLFKQVPVEQRRCAVPDNGIFMVTAIEHSGLESDTSSPCMASGSAARVPGPVKGWDKVAPAAPGAFTAKAESPGHIRLKWSAPADEDVRYYNLYFSAAGRPEAVQKRRFASPPKGCTEYLDWAAPKAAGGQYAVTAVDYQGNESTPARAIAQ